MLPQDNCAAKTVLLFFALAIIAIACTFFYQFLQTYKAELNQALFYSLIFFGCLLLFTATSLAVYATAMLYLQFQIKRIQTQEQQQQIQALTASNLLYSVTTKQIEAGQVFLSEQRSDHGIVKFKALPRHFSKSPEKTGLESAAVLPLLDLTPPEPKTTLLADIRDYQRILLVGGQNSGKTTLLKHIAKQRSSAGSVLVLDSHNAAGKWPRDYKIVGHGRDYNAIETELKNLVAIMDARYKELASGKVKEREHELITVISDEWTTVSKNINNLDIYLLPLLTESRKVRIDLILATHSQTAESLGLKGKADLKTAFDAILFLKNINGKRLIELDNGEAMVSYQHCGQYQDENDYVDHDFSDKLQSILNNPIVKKDLIHQQTIIDKYRELVSTNSFSWNQLSVLIYGKKGGHYINELKSVLSANNIVFD